MTEEIIFFKNPQQFREWLESNHLTVRDQWVGFYKKHTKLASITWPESVDQALCFGWIDGLRKSIDHQSYMIRFTPRKADSHWSAVNIKRIHELKKLGMVEPPGLEAYKKRKPDRSGRASYEQGKVTLAQEYEKKLKQQTSAWKDFSKMPPSYRKQCIWWIMSAKKEETRLKRLDILIESCRHGEKIPPLRWQK